MTDNALYPSFARAPLAFERGQGAWLYTTDGEAYLDFAAGIAVNSLGHAHPHLVEALTAQAQKLWHVSNLYEIPGQSRLAERLVENSFADRVFFTNSGAEAIECAIKTARRYHAMAGRPERYRCITFEGAFHGRTLATIAAGGQKKYLEGYGPVVDGFDQVPFGDIDAVRAAIGPATAAILVEPVQGEGGVREAPSGFLRALREICDANGLLLILDEVQSGVGRTGRLFAYQWSDIEPDIMAIAKGIGGGFPLGACLARAEVADCMTAGSHGTTFGGNPLAMAVGNAVLDIVLADGFLEDVRCKALVLRQSLASIIDTYPDIFAELRGSGLFIGLRCQIPHGEVLAALNEQKLLAVLAGDNVVRLLPPLVVTDSDISEAVERLGAAAEACRAARGEAKASA